ncbi:MAG: SDR family oxidoreductase [Caldilineaceae bacterium]|nr:SDR family oxidoreductase [Caldilineaceae bacterium]
MDLSCEGMRVVVTAGGAGIGRAITETLTAHGARLYICDVDSDRLTELRLALPNIGATLADVSDPAQVDRFIDAAIDHLGGLDVLINNAGIAGPAAPVEEVAVDEWDRTMAVNISGQFYCARRAVPYLKASGGGAIINLSSAAGLFGYPLRAPYATSKWAVIGFTKTLAMELGGHGIRVNAICPGPVEGPRIDGVIASRAEAQGQPFDAVRERYLQQNSLHTFIAAQEIADLVLFLCSDAGRKISGQALSIDGNTETLRI